MINDFIIVSFKYAIQILSNQSGNKIYLTFSFYVLFSWDFISLFRDRSKILYRRSMRQYGTIDSRHITTVVNPFWGILVAFNYRNYNVTEKYITGR